MSCSQLRRLVRTSMIRHRTFRLNLRLRETELRLERLAPTESVFANSHIGLRLNLDKGEPGGRLGSYLGMARSNSRREESCDRRWPAEASRHRSSIRQAHHRATASAVATSVGHRWSRFGRSASRRSSASRQASSARRAIVFMARTSILVLRSDCDEGRLATRWRTHAPCRVPPSRPHSTPMCSGTMGEQ